MILTRDSILFGEKTPSQKMSLESYEIDFFQVGNPDLKPLINVNSSSIILTVQQRSDLKRVLIFRTFLSVCEMTGRLEWDLSTAISRLFNNALSHLKP